MSKNVRYIDILQEFFIVIIQKKYLYTKVISCQPQFTDLKNTSVFLSDICKQTLFYQRGKQNKWSLTFLFLKKNMKFV